MTTREKSEIAGIVWVDPDRMSGAPCFTGTRVPVDMLLDHLKYGETIDDFLEACPTVSRRQVERFYELYSGSILESLQQ